LLFCLAFGIERAHWKLVLSIVLIMVGTSGSVIEESIAIDFSLMGLFLFMASSLTEAFRVVGADLLMGKDNELVRFNGAEALIFIGGPSSFLLLLGSFLFEDMGPGSNAWFVLFQFPLPFVAAVSMSFLVNLSCFLAIQASSSLTFKIAGSIKNVIVIVWGVVFAGETVTPYQILGYTISLLGFGLYAQMRKPEGDGKPLAGKKKKD
jgi:drug/metabolite transporter (DMT)-like permease